jgi:hypothetical protein
MKDGVKANALVKTKPAVSDLQMTPQKFVEAALASKLFKDTSDAAQAYIKITLGASLNLDPVTSMASIYLVQGKPSLSTNLMVARVLQRADRYRYEILETNDKKCSIQFWHRVEDYTEDGKMVKRWVKPGPPEVYSMEMAKTANLLKNPVWASHPTNMLFNRAFSNGCKKYCADLMNGVPLYAPEELDPNMKLTVTSDGDVIPDAEYIVQPQPTAPKLDTGLVADVRKLLADTGSDEKAFLTTLCSKDSAEKLTQSEAEKAIRLLQSKKANRPEPF